MNFLYPTRIYQCARYRSWDSPGGTTVALSEIRPSQARPFWAGARQRIGIVYQQTICGSDGWTYLGRERWDSRAGQSFLRGAPLPSFVPIAFEVKYPMSKDKGLLHRLPRVGFFQPVE